MVERLIKPFIFFVFAVLFLAGCGNDQRLPVYGPRNLSESGDTVYHKIPPFDFVNQDGKAVSSDELNGKILVTDVFFATCPGICPTLSGNMAKVQNAFADDQQINLISFTVDPERDTLEALKAYAESHGAIQGKWHLLTGEKAELYDVAQKGFFFKAFEDKNGNTEFIHDEHFALVDPEGRIRGYYDGTDDREVQKLMVDIKVLKDEYPED